MKIKAILFAATIFGATLFVTSTPETNNSNEDVQEQAIRRSDIKVPTHG